MKPSSSSHFPEYFRALNYVAAAQIFLQDNFLLQEPLKPEHIKARLLGHWGTVPGINFTWMHLNEIIKENNANMMFILGPGHGFPAIQASLFLEKTLTKYYKNLPYNYKGLSELIHKFSQAYGFPSHSNPGAPGMIVEGGELGYSLSTAFGAVMDNPDLIAACIIGDGEAETGPTAAAWHSNKFLDPKQDGAVLPILHLNGYKITGPTITGRMSDKELTKLYEGYGYKVHFVDIFKAKDPHAIMSETMHAAYKEIKAIQTTARTEKDVLKPQWPMVILRSAKGWTGIKTLHGQDIENNNLSHQIVVHDPKNDPTELKALEKWLKSYKIEELYDAKKGFSKDILAMLPPEKLRMGNNKHAFGGEIRKALKLPKLKNYAFPLGKRGHDIGFATKGAGTYFRDIIKNNPTSARLFCPDETTSNKLDAVYEAAPRAFQWPILQHDVSISPHGRTVEMLSEHTLQGMMQGYVLTGRHGIFSSYEAFIQIVSSMCDQYGKFLKASREYAWRKPVPSFNYLLASLGWRQDHNGFSHQNPGFVSNILEKNGNFASVYFPVDLNSTIAVMEECLTDTNCINVIVTCKQEALQWLSLDEARKQVKTGIGIWDFASKKNPDIVFASAGFYQTTETLAAVKWLRERFPEIKTRYVNVSEMTALGVSDPRSLTTNKEFNSYFTPDKHVIFNYHGYTADVKHLIFDTKEAPSRFHIHGYMEEGSTTTPFDMHVRNQTSRYHLIMDALEIMKEQNLAPSRTCDVARKEIENLLLSHRAYITEFGTDPEWITEWKWE
ncbi:MAG: phosphoketolase family protein [Candidatus Gracilibacteria bacterium]